MKRKRIWSLFLILALALSLTACNATVTVDTDVTASTSVISATTTDGVEATGATTIGNITVESIPVTVTKPQPSKTVITAKPIVTTTKAPTTKVPTTATTVSSAEKQLVDRAFQLAQGEKIENATLKGVVTSSQGYSAGYNNATFDLQVQGTDGAKTIYCYRVKPADSSRADVAEGDYLSLTGTIQNYKGTIEFYPAEYTHLSGGGAVVTTRPTNSGNVTIDEDGIYDSKEEVALYIHTYGKLPKNYVTKSQYNKKDKYQCVGGDRFYNNERLLPTGEIYYECDIDTYGITSRGAKRLVWTKSGIVYYTANHYESFVQLYGERE